jgi:paraquat-inducible protein A
MSIACPDCGTVTDLFPLERGSVAICPTCEHHLERTSGRSIDAALACALATFVLLFPANLLPLMKVSILGMSRESRIESGVVALWNEQWLIVAVLVAAFVIVLPFLRFGLLTVVLAGVRLGYRPAWLGRAFRWTIHLDRWAMPDVFLIACFVGYSRVTVNLQVSIGWGGVCFVAAAFLCMLSRATLDRRTVWRALGREREPPAGHAPVISCTVCDLVLPVHAEGSRCPRCDARLRARRPDVMVRTLALVLAGFALYIPSNTYPMSIATQLGEEVPHRIVDGIRELFQAGLWPLGVVIFCTSVAIPFVKLAGLSWFLLSIRRKSSSRLVFKTKLYRFIDEIGRWSNVDVFIISVFVPLLHFGALANTRAATGAPAFIAVVALTMFASRAFDPRLIWDAGRARTP